MAATTLYANWTGVVFTPASGSATTFTRVSALGFDPGSELTPYKGDANRYPVAMVNFNNSPGASLTCENIGQTSALSPGTRGSLVGILNDAVNGAGAGSFALQFTLANAIVENTPIDARHAQFASATVRFRSYSADGVTNPLTVTVL